LKEITIDELESARVATQKIIHQRVDGSSMLQALVIYPNYDIIKASPRLCSCQKCLADYGSCELFQEYQLFSYELNQVSLRSTFETYDSTHRNNAQRDDINQILCKGSVVAVAADDKSP